MIIYKIKNAKATCTFCREEAKKFYEIECEGGIICLCHDCKVEIDDNFKSGVREKEGSDIIISSTVQSRKQAQVDKERRREAMIIEVDRLSEMGYSNSDIARILKIAESSVISFKNTKSESYISTVMEEGGQSI